MRKKINIGRTDLQALPFNLGGNVFGWTADERASHEILDRYVGEGFQLIDTADSYSHWGDGHKGGESETVMGNWLKKTGKRKEVIIATKVGSKYQRKEFTLASDYIRQQVEQSLRQLQTDYIDIYYSHYDDPTTPLEDTLSTYADLVKEGKVRYIATSNMTADRIRESIALSREKGYPEYMIVQPEYNMHKRESYETQLEPLMIEYNLAVMPYFSLGAGFLTGKYKSMEEAKNKSNPRSVFLGDYLDERGDRILKTLHAVADEYSATSAQIALSWLIARPSITAPIASVSNADQLDILKSVDIVLTKDVLDRLNEASKY